MPSTHDHPGAQSSTQPKAPAWVWAFAAACGAIPVVAIGGLIPSVLGGAGATVCYALARDGRGAVGRRALACSLVTLGAWGLFGGVALVAYSSAPQSTTRSSSTGVTTSRSVYRNGELVSVDHGRAERTDPAEMSESELRAIYLDAVSDRSESHQSFVASHNKLFKLELMRLVERGDEAGWDE
jgi:hypothetical protein